MGESHCGSYSDADGQVRDVEDVFLVIETVLNMEVAPLSVAIRDALATVARLGRDRANAARHSLDKAVGVAHG